MAKKQLSATAGSARNGRSVSATSTSRSPLRRATSGAFTTDRRREFARGVSPAVKRAVDHSIRDNRQALRELEKA
jgi:hypothetical protein